MPRRLVRRLNSGRRERPDCLASRHQSVVSRRGRFQGQSDLYRHPHRPPRWPRPTGVRCGGEKPARQASVGRLYPALSIEDYWEASAANFRVTGRMLSKQADGIRRKIREVDSGMTPDRQARVHEVHPELCFWAINDHEPALSNKKRLAGRHERWQSLRTVLPLQPEPPRPRDLPHACAVDDYIDALVAAWTAVCISRGSAQRIPSQPEMDEKGLRMEMWFPAV